MGHRRDTFGASVEAAEAEASEPIKRAEVSVTPKASAAIVSNVPAASMTKYFGKAPRDVGIGIATGVVGALAWKEHRVLGFILGSSIGATAVPLVKGEDRISAACEVAVDGAGVAGSLAWKKHPVWGFIFGYLAGAIATKYVPGNNGPRLSFSTDRAEASKK